MSHIQRVDIINPLGDGGLLENNLASFIFGTPIDTVFGSYETMALIGIVPVLFAILALIWGDNDITIPSFFTILFSLIWADGGRTILSFIHLLPLLDTLRNAGRIFGAIFPIILLLSIYGVYLLHQKWKNNDTFEVTGEEKKKILYGAGLLLLVKLLELPWTTTPALESALAVLLVAGFLLLLYLNKTTFLSLAAYFTVALIVDIGIILKNFNVLTESVIIKGLSLTFVLFAVILWFNRPVANKAWLKTHLFEGVLIIGILVSITGNITVLNIYDKDPRLDQSQAIPIIEKIKEIPSINSQIWVYTYGWQFQHMDFTYWLIKNHMHPMVGHFSFLPKNIPPLVLTLGDTEYYTADYIIDTAYLENGNENLPNVTFKVNNISVYKPDHVFPNAFVIRNDQLIPATIQKFSPDEVTLSGQFSSGDVAVLKTSYYPGWNMNGQETSNVQNMVGARISSDTTTVTFRFDPLDVKIAALLSGIGIIFLIALIVKRRAVEQYLAGLGKIPAQRQKKKKA